MFQQLYDLINQYVFSGAIVPDSYTDLVCTIASTIGVFALVAIPFYIVYKVTDLIFRGW